MQLAAALPTAKAPQIGQLKASALWSSEDDRVRVEAFLLGSPRKRALACNTAQMGEKENQYARY